MRIKPWHYFRLNEAYFNQSKGLFSKLDIDKLTPLVWRLPQWVDEASRQPERYPVFVKPEWGQNSQGIGRADNLAQLNQLRLDRGANAIQYLVQEAATGAIEFEIFSIANHRQLNQSAVLSVTQVHNSGDETYPINGIYNRQTSYHDLTPTLTLEQRHKLTQMISQIGLFKICRVGVRANSLAALINGDFQVIEINLFVPMPLVLLSRNTPWRAKVRFVLKAMVALAKVTKRVDTTEPAKAIFFQKIGLMRRSKNINEMSNESN